MMLNDFYKTCTEKDAKSTNESIGFHRKPAVYGK